VPGSAPESAPLGMAAAWEVRGWSGVAIGSLAVAGVFALLLAVSRIPGIEDVFPWPLGFFHKGLVIHVVFSFVIWFLAVFGALLALVGAHAGGGEPRFAGVGRIAVLGATASCPLLFIPALLDRGEPTLNNYVPVIIDPLYYAGIAVLAVSVALAVLRYFAAIAGRPAAREPVPLALTAGGVIFLIAVMCGLIALALLADEAPSFSFNEELFWGSGHVLQFLNTLLLVTAWFILAGSVPNRSGGSERLIVAAIGLLTLAALAAPVFYVLFETFSAEQAQAFTDLQYALAPPALLAALAVVGGWSRPLPWREPTFLCLVLSALVFAAGGFLGLFVDGADTRTPAHYHGVIAGVTLAFMGLFFVVFLPALGRPVRRNRWLYAQIWLFAVGQFAACIGLFLAGGFGAPRKTAGGAQGLEDIGAIAGMAMNGAGALVAVIGGVLFIWTAAAALLRRPGAEDSPSGAGLAL